MIPSLLQIPSAVSDSKLHSVLPNNGKGDFTFDRSTGATRINKDGLIEEVGYFSSELVQNGNFSELGSELVTNGDFATNSDWTLATGWSINNGKAHNVGVDGYLRQDMTLVNGKTYKVVFTVSNYVSGSVRVRFMGGTSVSGGFKSSNDTFTQYLTSTGNSNVRLQSDDFVGSIDNVSVKQVDPNDRWTLESNWAYGSNKVTGSAATSEIQQDIDLPSGKVYKTTFTIEDYVSGTVRIRFRGGSTVNGTQRSGNGTYTEILTSTGHTNIRIDGGTAFTGSVTNISVVEVQGDRPRLSYDITNGVVEDKPHLLLEPSSTNLITFSEDLNRFPTKSQISVSSNVAISPDGTQNADKLIPNTSNVSTHYIRQDISVSNGVGYVISFFAKKGEYNYVNTYTSAYSTGVSATWDLNAGVVILGGANADIQDFGNGWYRCIWKGTTNSTSLSYRIYVSELEDRDAAFAGDGIKGIYVWGATLEQQAFATSYIKTAGTTITRAAETCNNSKPSVNSTEGVLYCEIAALADDGTNRRIELTDGTSSNRIGIGLTTVANQIKYFLIAGGASQVNLNVTISNTLQYNKIAFKYKANDFELYVNGSSVSTDTSGSVSAANTLNVLDFSSLGSTNVLYGKVKGLAVYNEALSESQLMQLTGVTASSIYSNFVTRTASFTVEALNEVKKVIDNL